MRNVLWNVVIYEGCVMECVNFMNVVIHVYEGYPIDCGDISND